MNIADMRPILDQLSAEHAELLPRIQRLLELAQIQSPGLAATVDADLEHWCPDGTRTVSSPAADAYRARLEQAGEWGGFLVAHHYTRYLGDLSGGQAIGRILDRTFGLDGKGVSFYDFPEIEKPKIYKDGYRARLDALGLSPEDQDRVVAEVKVAFRLNQAMFVELGQHLSSYAR